MRIGISDDRKWGDRHYAMLKSFGFDCYDYKMSNTDAVPYIYNDEEFDAFLKRARDNAESAGFRIWQVHGPWRGPRDRTEEDRAERLEKMKRSIHGAAVLGAKYWVIHPIMPFGLHDLVTGEAEQTRELNISFMSKLLDTAKREGVVLCLENMPFTEYSLSAPEAIIDVVKAINDPYFAMCLDTGHANVCADWMTPAETVRQYSEYVKVLHVHDNEGELDQHLLPFCGTIDWNDFTAALKETDFDGVVSLECSPNSNLPDDILKDMYRVFAKTARAVADGIAK